MPLRTAVDTGEAVSSEAPRNSVVYEPPPEPPPGRPCSETGSDDPDVEHAGVVYTKADVVRLVNEVKDYQITHGSLLKLVRYETESSVAARPVSVSILPTPFPKALFDEATDLQHVYTELYVRVASDPDWLYSVLEPLIEHDQYIGALWVIYVKVRDAGALQEFVCSVIRNDYMLHQPPGQMRPCLKQVEINPFSCAGACHSEGVAAMHRDLGNVRSLTRERSMTDSQKLATNINIDSIVALLQAAYDIYKASPSRKRCVLMTVQPLNFNIADEQPIVYKLWDNSIPCYRCEWQTILDHTTLVEDRTLLFKPPSSTIELEVSVIYHRAGYEAKEYDDRGVATRLRLELSRAIKCPDILTNFTTFKEVQRALTVPGAVELFLSFNQAERIRRTFMYMQTLDTSPLGLEARKIALDPQEAINHVLKPNRDGGGNNIYRTDIPLFLAQLPQYQWSLYVLMRLIEPPETKGHLMMPQALYHGPVISELGILGTCFWRRGANGEVAFLRNDLAGWTFKTKPRDIDEMSVVKGYGCFDCPLLTDTNG